MRAEADDEDWGGYSDNPRIAEQLRTKQSHTKQRASMDQEAAKRIVSADPALEARMDAAAAERLAAAERAMAAREKDHNSTLQRQREEERRREEEAIRRAEDRRRQDEERQRVEEERRRKEAQRRADWQADSYRRDYRRDKYNWREDYHQPQPHIPGGFAKGDTVASRVSALQRFDGDAPKVDQILAKMRELGYKNFSRDDARVALKAYGHDHSGHDRPVAEIVQIIHSHSC